MHGGQFASLFRVLLISIRINRKRHRMYKLDLKVERAGYFEELL